MTTNLFNYLLSTTFIIQKQFNILYLSFTLGWFLCIEVFIFFYNFFKSGPSNIIDITKKNVR